MTARRWNAGDRWARAAGCTCPDQTRAAGDWTFLDAEPWRFARPREQRAAGYPSRAAGTATQNYDVLKRAICSTPGWSELSAVGRNVLNAGSTAELTRWVVGAYDAARDASFGLLPRVSTTHIRAVFDAMDGVFAVCAPRAGGLRGDSLRVLATAIDVVGSPVAAVPLYAVSAAVGASGLLIEVVGAAVTGWIGVGMAAVVGLCEILVATGVPAQLRKVAGELDAEEAAAATNGGGGLIDLPTWGYPIKLPRDGTAVPATDGGGGGALALGGLAAGLLILKAVL